MGEVKTSFPGIDGVVITPLKQFRDHRGAVMHMIRADSPQFKSFGEIYFSFVVSGAVKGWKRHQRMTQNFAVPVGMLKLVLFDDRDGSPTKGITQEIVMGADAYGLVTISPMIWYAFTSIGSSEAMIANMTDMPHDPAESETRELHNGPVAYQW